MRLVMTGKHVANTGNVLRRKVIKAWPKSSVFDLQSQFFTQVHLDCAGHGGFNSASLTQESRVCVSRNKAGNECQLDTFVLVHNL